MFLISVDNEKYTLPLSYTEIEALTEEKALQDVNFTLDEVLANIDINIEDVQNFDLDSLNSLADSLQSIEDDLETVDAFIEIEGKRYFLENSDEICRSIKNSEIILYNNMYGAEYAENFITEIYNLDDIPSLIVNNVDWQNVFDDLEDATETSYGVLVQQ